MTTVTIDILNDKAIRLLRDLEEMNLIRILGKDARPSSKELTTVRTRPSDYKGIIPSEVAEKLQDYVRKSREEW